MSNKVFPPLPANSCISEALTGKLWYFHISQIIVACIAVFVFNGNASEYRPRRVWMPPPGTAWHSDCLPAETQTQTRRARHRCIIPRRLYHLPSAPVRSGPGVKSSTSTPSCRPPPLPPLSWPDRLTLLIETFYFFDCLKIERWLCSFEEDWKLGKECVAYLG